jgi:hypothetical protein
MRHKLGPLGEARVNCFAAAVVFQVIGEVVTQLLTLARASVLWKLKVVPDS